MKSSNHLLCQSVKIFDLCFEEPPLKICLGRSGSADLEGIWIWPRRTNANCHL